MQIDAETFELTLYDEYDSTLDVDTLSAGERQIIATSIIWALSQASSICYPTVIDTPLGRLDSSHRKALCSGYFPNASNQVILLSTDEEIIGPYYSIIDDHCSNKLTLRYDGETRSSRIEAGYFVEKVA